MKDDNLLEEYMPNKYDCKIPQTNQQEYSRLFSIENVSYFLRKATRYESANINKIDPDHRIFADKLIQLNCKLVSSLFITNQTKEQMDLLWNKIKREEKEIRKNGIPLFFLDGKSIEYKDPNYRVFWPSYEAFSAEYVKDCINNWITFDVPSDNQNIKICSERLDLFDNNLSIYPLSDNYERFFIRSEKPLTRETWRRYTQTLIELLSIEQIVDLNS